MATAQGQEWYAARRSYPLVSSAAELAMYLRDVQRRGGGWEYCADAPCHNSTSKTSFVFKDTARGGLDIHCFACFDTAGSADQTFADIVEDALRIRINLEYADGRLRWDDNYQKPSNPIVRIDRNKRDVSVTHTPEKFSMRDLLYSSIWIPTVITEDNARIPLEFSYEGQQYGFAQSHKDKLAWCQLGSGQDTITRTDKRGKSRQVILLGWDTARACIDKGNELGANAIGLCLSGASETSALTDIGAIDFDYKPSGDADLDRVNVTWRNQVRSYLENVGCPVINSLSGNGFHALFRQNVGDDWLFEDREKVKALVPEKRQGAGIDFYPAGSKRLVNIIWQNITEPVSKMNIPYLRYEGGLDGMLFPDYDIRFGGAVQTPAQALSHLNTCNIHETPMPCEFCRNTVIGKCEYCQEVGQKLWDKVQGARRCQDEDACFSRHIAKAEIADQVESYEFAGTVWRQGEHSTGTCGYCDRVNQSLAAGVCWNETKCFTTPTYESPDDIDTLFLAYFKRIHREEGESIKDAIIRMWMAEGKPIV